MGGEAASASSWGPRWNSSQRRPRSPFPGVIRPSSLTVAFSTAQQSLVGSSPLIISAASLLLNALGLSTLRTCGSASPLSFSVFLPRYLSVHQHKCSASVHSMMARRCLRKNLQAATKFCSGGQTTRASWDSLAYLSGMSPCRERVPLP